eukprot:SAG11_NODE_2705_length_3073_cov_2.609953_2_plen_96_part_00
MGFNKNVSKYISIARDFAAAHPGSHTTFIHNNDYTEETLDECFERNSNGLVPAAPLTQVPNSQSQHACARPLCAFTALAVYVAYRSCRTLACFTT